MRSLPGKKVCGGHDGDGHDGVDDIVTTMMGKKNMVGALHGPMNEENLNRCMSPILAGCPGLNFNNDIQIPYRFPIIEEIHDESVCTGKC